MAGVRSQFVQLGEARGHSGDELALSYSRSMVLKLDLMMSLRNRKRGEPDPRRFRRWNARPVQEIIHVAGYAVDLAMISVDRLMSFRRMAFSLTIWRNKRYWRGGTLLTRS
jgi:hypothetical protein